MIPSALHLPTGEEERSKGKSQQNKYENKKQSTKKQFPESLSKRRGEIIKNYFSV